MTAANSITNEQRAEFLRKLDGSDLVVTDWEAQFIASFLGAYRWWNWFTAGRQASVDQMWMKYGAMLALPYPVARPTGKNLPIEDAAPDACQYRVMEDGRQRVCNEPAELMRANRFRYCRAHGDQVRADLKRRGKTIHLIPFTKG